ncbi:MAG: 3'-5' exonuclease [Clostridia bacterium]|nr:3'-5' exonuclease [Clostridia bacterium]
MDFVAIDFETATSKWTSICSMGICVVENNEIKEVKELLVKPVPFEFNEYNIAIHGITPQEVMYKPTFDKYWAEIEPYLQNKVVIAHNASFDIGALTKTLDMFGLELPEFKYLCTVKLSQKAYPELPSHKLNCLGDSLGIDFSHHTACDDAYACAMVLVHILEDFGINSLEEIEERFEIGVGKVFPGYVEPCRKNKKKNKVTQKSH